MESLADHFRDVDTGLFAKHQVMKLPTEQGVRQVKSNQQVS